MTDEQQPAPEIVDVPERRRFEARLDGRVVAFSDYRLVGDRIVFLHTETDPELEGRGIGSALVRHALDDVRQRRLGVTAKCPFVSAWIERHPEYQDLLRDR